MKLFLFFLYTIMSLQLKAVENVPELEIWRIGSRYYSFLRDKETKSLVSENCLEKKKDCMALKAIGRKKSVKISDKETIGGKNPGAVVCKNVYGAEVLILQNSAGLESSFCLFKDNTQASTSDLY